MRKVNNTPWIAGAVFVSIVIIAVGYFFGVMPRLDDAAELNEQAESQESLNEILDLKVRKLAADFAKLPEYEAEIKELEVGIPLVPQLPELIRITDDIANENDVILTRTALPAPEAVTIPDALEGAIDVEGLVRMPIEYEIVGEYEDIFAFINGIQTEYPRHVLIRDFTLSGNQVDEDVDDPDLTFMLTVMTDMYAMVKDGVPLTHDIDYDIPGLAPPVDAEEGGDDAESDDEDADPAEDE